MANGVRPIFAWGLVLLAVLVLTGCAAGTGSEWSQEAAEPAGFWAGLWHGALLLVSLIVSFFADTVSIFETNNSGTGYEIGFVLGVLIVYGGSSRVRVTRKTRVERAEAAEARAREESWDEIARGVEAKVKAKISAFATSEDEDDWKEIGDRVEQVLKERIRSWVDEEEAKQTRPDSTP